MCALCGVLGGSEHWADAHARPGAFTRNTSPLERRRERARRVTEANRILGHFGLGLSDWQGTAFQLSTRTGKTELVDNLSHLWAAAEKLLGRPVDPLDPGLLARLERRA
ncbi:hypothetical protein [Lichenifustis flavocetrariae]|uniref:Uncharacterized protein n=1 Tax=Lichenifustis flavocetrariae TaxID=2949735 RepID=A0AA42CI70_9HYPH|nr:hypothetical protein [Lichenifustis flavocetrariae]MCW6508283.1 hypothetical protein [Lichenifustis flavocetrariae]